MLCPPLSFVLSGCFLLSCAGVKYDLFGNVTYYLKEFERYPMLSSSSCHQKQSELFFKKFDKFRKIHKEIPVAVSFLIKLQAWLATYLKRDFDTGVFLNSAKLVRTVFF